MSQISRQEFDGTVTSGRTDIGDLLLESGDVIRDCTISYTVHGQPNERRSNVILGTTALGSDHHRLDFMIGPDKALDPRLYCVIVIDALGNGLSSSPSNSAVHPGREFPQFSIRDMVESQRLLLESLSIGGLRAIVGASMGGMQALQWAVSHPMASSAVIAITPLARTPPWTILVHSLARDLLVEGSALTHRSGGRETWIPALHLLEAIASRTPKSIANEVGTTDVRAWLAVQHERWVRHSLSPIDWVYQSWAYDGHDVGATPPFGGDTAAALQSIVARTMLLVPALDLYNPVDDTHWAAGQIAGCELTTFESAEGHSSATGRIAASANEINDLVTGFLATLT